MDTLKTIPKILALFLLVASSAWGQGFLYQNVLFTNAGAGGGAGLVKNATVAVCNPAGLATTAASVSGNVAALTMASNPQTAGFSAQGTITVSGFTGSDTYFNGNFVLTAVSSTTLTFNLTHSNASASSNGAVVQTVSLGAQWNCAPYASIYTNAQLTTVENNPTSTDNYGNYSFAAAPGTYNVSFLGGGVSASEATVTLPCVASSNCPLYSLEGLIFVDGVKYTNIASALAALPSAGGTVIVPPHYRETFTSSINVGSTGGTQGVHLHLSNDVLLTCNVTSGSYCIGVFGPSRISGENIGASSSLVGGSVIQLASTANVSAIVCSSHACGYSYQEFFGLDHVTLSSSSAGGETVSDSLLHVEGIYVPSSVDSVSILNSADSTIGLHITSYNSGVGSLHGVANVTFKDVWSYANSQTGARPCVIQYISGNGISSLDFIGGACEDAQQGGINVEINGNGHLNAVSNLNFINHHIENLASSTTSQIGYKITDVMGLTLIGNFQYYNSTSQTAAVSINQSSGALTGNIVVQNLTYPGTFPAILNSITGESIVPGGSSPGISYVYTGDGGLALPLYWSGQGTNQFGYGNFNVLSTSVNFNDQADADSTITFSSGKTATHNVYLNFADRGTTEWEIQKDTSNNLNWWDAVTGVLRLGYNASNGNSYLGSESTGAVVFNGQSNNGTGGVKFYGGGSSPSQVAAIDGSGNISGRTITAPEISTPSNPPSGSDTVYLNSSTHTLNCLTSSGGSCLGGPVTIQIFSNKNLGSSVSLSASTLTTVDSISETMPSSGGSWRVQVCFAYGIQAGTGVYGEAYATDGTNVFAKGSLITNSNGGVYSACGWSPVTYSNSANETFTVKAENTGSQTIQTTLPLTGVASGMQVTIVSSN